MLESWEAYSCIKAVPIEEVSPTYHSKRTFKAYGLQTNQVKSWLERLAGS